MVCEFGIPSSGFFKDDEDRAPAAKTELAGGIRYGKQGHKQEKNAESR